MELVDEDDLAMHKCAGSILSVRAQDRNELNTTFVLPVKGELYQPQEPISVRFNSEDLYWETWSA